jgi:hypothetical protein
MILVVWITAGDGTRHRDHPIIHEHIYGSASDGPKSLLSGMDLG